MVSCGNKMQRASNELRRLWHLAEGSPIQLTCQSTTQWDAHQGCRVPRAMQLGHFNMAKTNWQVTCSSLGCFLHCCIAIGSPAGGVNCVEWTPSVVRVAGDISWRCCSPNLGWKPWEVHPFARSGLRWGFLASKKQHSQQVDPAAGLKPRFFTSEKCWFTIAASDSGENELNKWWMM